MSETPLKQNFFEAKIKLMYFYFLKFMTPILIILSPSLLSWLSHFDSKIRRLPSLRHKLKMTKNPLDEFIFYSEISKKFREVNVIMRGRINQRINKKLPTFIINSYEARKHFPNRFYSTSDRLMFKAMMGKPENKFLERFVYKDNNKKFHHFMPINRLAINKGLDKKNLTKSVRLKKIKMLKKELNFKYKYDLSLCFHSFKGTNIQIGSGILAVISLLFLSKKVNVYGWDAFLKHKIPKNYFNQTLNLWSDFSEFQPISRFSAIVLNWIYAHRLMNYFPSSRLIIHGRVKNILKLKWIESRLYKIIYK